MKKTILFLTASVGAVILALLLIYLVPVGTYPDLNTCFKASVSKKLICSKNSDYVQLSEVSEYFQKAVVMSEDDSFYAHDGFDWKELKNSMMVNLRKFSYVRGGSTITQQLVKNVYLNRKKTIFRKIVEAKLADQIEENHSKKLILEKYVNAIEFGDGLWGIKQAAQFYFRKPPSQLDALESLYLVVLLPSPKRYSKTFFEKELSSYQKRRMKSLLERMKKRGHIPDHEYTYAKDKIEWFFKEQPIEVDRDAENWANESETEEVGGESMQDEQSEDEDINDDNDEAVENFEEGFEIDVETENTLLEGEELELEPEDQP